METFPSGFTAAPAVSARCAGSLTERDRLEWRLDQGGDPARLVEDFLAGHGLPVGELGRPGAGTVDHAGDGICGAALFISAAAGNLLAGAAAGPVPATVGVPDLVAVVYAHAPFPGPPAPAPAPWPPTPALLFGSPTPDPFRERRATDGPAGWQLGPWRPSWTAAEHASAVELARTSIARGDIYQVNVVGHASAPYTGDPRPALARLAGLPGARYGGLLTGAGWAIGCASPETLIEVTGGRALTRPIKGTRPATGEGHRQLRESTKERAEHIMIVDLERNDLARVARTGSVRVDELYAVRRWCDLWQAESTISAALADGIGLADLLRAVCPGGSVTGAPKLAAVAQIAALEPVGRGVSMGALGWVGADRIDLGLTIRTAVADAERMHLWAGGGITWDSEPAAEVAEAAAKAAPLRAALAGR